MKTKEAAIVLDRYSAKHAIPGDGYIIQILVTAKITGRAVRAAEDERDLENVIEDALLRSIRKGDFTTK